MKVKRSSAMKVSSYSLAAQSSVDESAAFRCPDNLRTRRSWSCPSTRRGAFDSRHMYSSSTFHSAIDNGFCFRIACRLWVEARCRRLSWPLRRDRSNKWHFWVRSRFRIHSSTWWDNCKLSVVVNPKLSQFLPLAKDQRPIWMSAGTDSCFYRPSASSRTSVWAGASRTSDRPVCHSWSDGDSRETSDRAACKPAPSLVCQFRMSLSTVKKREIKRLSTQTSRTRIIQEWKTLFN